MAALISRNDVSQSSIVDEKDEWPLSPTSTHVNGGRGILILVVLVSYLHSYWY